MLATRIAMGALAALCAVGAGCGDHGVWYTALHGEIVNGEAKGDSGICGIAFGGRFGEENISGSGGSGDRDFYYTHTREGDSLVVVIKSQAKELARREYSEEQLRSGERDQFTVTTLMGRMYQLTYWGGSECELAEVETGQADAGTAR